MMATRLTKEIRDEITTQVLRHRFQESVENLISDRAAFAEAVYEDIYRKADREKMQALPKGWLLECSSISAQFGHAGRGYETIEFSGAFYGELARMRKTLDGSSRIERRVLSKHSYGCVKSYDAEHRLSAKHGELELRFGTLKSEFEAAKRQVLTAVASVTTINRLIEIWPEVAPFAIEFDETPAKLPSVPTKELNRLLDLPVAA